MYKVTLKVDYWETSFTFPDFAEAAAFAGTALLRADKEIVAKLMKDGEENETV